MKETFEQDLSKEQQQEKEAQARFEELIAEKKRGIEAARERKNTKAPCACCWGTVGGFKVNDSDCHVNCPVNKLLSAL